MEIEIRRKHVVVAGVLVLVVGTAVTWKLTRPAPTPWLDYPTDGKALVTQFMNLIHEDTKASHDKAYALVNMPDKLPDDERHLQVYHEINVYFKPLFGDDWEKGMVVTEVEPGSRYAVRVETETLHIELARQGPKDGPVTDHLGVLGIVEFPLEEGPAAAQMEAITAIFGAAGGKAAGDNLAGIIAARGNFLKLTHMQMKRVILPVVRNPNNQNVRGALLRLWPVREDKTVVEVLKSIRDDERYGMDARKTAEQVLDGTVDETELVAAGVVN